MAKVVTENMEDPWRVLGIAPTEDVRAVKSAYFRALPAVQPHADPEGFQRLRRAYEALMAPGALASAAWCVVPDLDALESALSAGFLEQIALARRTAQVTRARNTALEQVRRRYGAVSWAEAVRLAGGAGAESTDTSGS